MLKKNKFKILISSLLILLPILFGIILWKDLPDVMATHWGADGNVDGRSGKAFAVFGLPCILLVLHFICLLATLLDKKQKEQNEKALGMIFWIIPAISLFVNGIMYRVAFGQEFDMAFVLPVLMGVMFIFMGNYLPKVKHNEENWNKTHRFGGKVWVVGGFLSLFSIFLPVEAMVCVSLCVVLAMVTIPVAYSYHIYRQHKKAGIVYEAAPQSKGKKITARIISGVLCLATLVGIVVLMFTGDIEVLCEDATLQINATYWTDAVVDYSQIDGAEYREELSVGVRTNGFASARLALGVFQNDEFGYYTLYSYTGAQGFIVLTSQGKNLVIGLKDPNEAKALYEALQNKMNQ